MTAKKDLRSIFLNYRKNIDNDKVEEYSIKIKNKLLRLNEIEQALNIMVYVSYKNEVKTHWLIKRLLVEDRNVYVPYCLVEERKLKIANITNMDKDLKKDAYGILEPVEDLRVDVSPEVLDAVIVPGTAFSRNGYRIGYGGGYYDKFLSCLPEKTISIGLTYDTLLVESLPIEKHDLPVDIIVTENDIIYCNNI